MLEAQYGGRGPIIAKSVTNSTNDDARALLEQGQGQHLSMVWAEQQTQGRGRLGRAWVSPRGNLYSSTLLRAPDNLQQLPQLVFVVAMAVWQTLRSHIPAALSLQLKWPNDVMLEGGKLTGMLIETQLPTHSPTSAGPHGWLIVGIGMNLTTAPPAQGALFPPTCLADHGVPIPALPQLAAELQENLGREYHAWHMGGFAPLRTRYLQQAFRLGQSIRIGRRADKTDYEEGIYQGLSTEGDLLLKDTNGTIQVFRTGDVLMPLG